MGTLDKVVSVAVGTELITFAPKDLIITDPASERYESAAWVAYWGVVAASAKSEVNRQLAALLNDEKMAEWKAKAKVGEATAVMEKVEAIYNAWLKKHEMLREMTASERPAKGASRDLAQSDDTKPDPRLTGFKQRRTKE